MEQKTGFEIMDTALFILSHAIEINIDLQLLIIDLGKKISNAAMIFKKVKPLWQHQKDTENVFWNKFSLFSKTSIHDRNLFLTIKDFERFYARVLEKIVFKLAFHSMNAKPLVFTSSNLLLLLNHAVINKNAPQMQSLQSYISIVKYILQENIAFQKLILELMFDENYITSIEMKKFQRFTGEQNLEFLHTISPFIQQYCNQSKQRIFGYATEKWKMPEQFMKMMYSKTPEHFVSYLEDTIKKQTGQNMDQEQTYIYNKFVMHHKYAQNHLELQGQILAPKQQNQQNQPNYFRKLGFQQNKKFKRRQGSIRGRLDIKRKSILNQMKSKTEYKRNPSILNDKELSAIDNLQHVQSSLMLKVSTIKSRQSILQSLHSFIDQYNENSTSQIDSNTNTTSKNTDMDEPIVSLIKLSNLHIGSRASIQIQTTPLASNTGIIDGLVKRKTIFKKGKISEQDKQNMFNKMRYMKAVGHTVVPNERRSIKTIAKLINFQKQRIPSYQQNQNKLRKSLMNRVLNLLGNKIDFSNSNYYSRILDQNNNSLQQWHINNKSRDSIQKQNQAKRKKSRFAQESNESDDRYKTEIVDNIKNKVRQRYRNYRSTSVKQGSIDSQTNLKRKQRSISTSHQARKGYDIFDTRSRQIVHQR